MKTYSDKITRAPCVRAEVSPFNIATIAETMVDTIIHKNGIIKISEIIPIKTLNKITKIFIGTKVEHFRKIIKEMGCGLIYAEMVSDKAITFGNQKTIDMLYMTDYERPIAQQIFGSDKESFVTSAKYMFYACDALEEQIACFPSLENGNSMYQLCSNLTSLVGNAAKFPSLISGRRMFRDANKLALKKGGNKSGVNEFYFPVLVDGLSLFQNCNQVEVIPCNFPRLRNARQMFLNCNISGHLELDFPT